MKEKIVRVMLVAGLMVMVLAGFAGCSKEITCSRCGQKVEVSVFYNNDNGKYWCDDCMEIMGSLFNKN